MQSKLRRRNATSRIAQGPALPSRTLIVARYDALLIGRSADWLAMARQGTRVGAPPSGCRGTRVDHAICDNDAVTLASCAGGAVAGGLRPARRRDSPAWPGLALALLRSFGCAFCTHGSGIPGGGSRALGHESRIASSADMRQQGHPWEAAPHPLPRERSLSRQAMTAAPSWRTTGPSSPIRHTGSRRAGILSAPANSVRSSPQMVTRSSEHRVPSSTVSTPTSMPSLSGRSNVTIRYLTIQNFGTPGATAVRGSSTTARVRAGGSTT